MTTCKESVKMPNKIFKQSHIIAHKYKLCSTNASPNWIEIYLPLTTLHPCFQPNTLQEKRCLRAVCAVCSTVWWMAGFPRLHLSCFSSSGCIGRSVCLFPETLFLNWASIVMCVADGDTNFRPHNNRTDSLFPVLLYVVPGSLQLEKSTHIQTTLQLQLVP